jgi:ribosome-associated toxin RatA of RatAB toxin-antitoxin module
MRHLEITSNVHQATVDGLFQRLCDMREFPKFSDRVVSLDVKNGSDGSAVSTWKVKFGPGTADWSQQDDFDPENRTIRFKRLSGDIDWFEGTWRVRENGAGSVVEFRIDFDIHLPGLKKIVEPMVENLLRENIQAILVGLFGASDFTTL